MTKVGEMLEHYPHLEEKLIELAPAFKKLKNPVLRKTIAKVTSLEQASKVGGISVEKLVNTMRKEVGQDMLAGIRSAGNDEPAAPGWFDQNSIVKTLDARPLIESGEQPLSTIIEEAKSLSSGEIIEVISPFLPAPLIDQLSKMGFSHWSKKENQDLYRNFFYKP